MRRYALPLLLAAAALFLMAPRWASDKPGAGRARITIYRVATGKQADFLKWMAVQDEVSREAGVGPVQLYTHINGDDWDYIGIAPVATPEQDRIADEIAAKRGLKTGLQASLEFRELVASHTDTITAGPMTAAELVAMLAKQEKPSP